MLTKLTHTLRQLSRSVLPLLACTLVVACSSVSSGRHDDLLYQDEVYSPNKSYFYLDNSAQRQDLVVQSLNLIGVPYLWGGEDPQTGLDCSGLIVYVVQQVSGNKLIHYTADLANSTRPIKRHELTAGDWVFFNTSHRKHSHVGVYIGNGRFVHAPAPGYQVRIDKLSSPYFGPRLDGLRTVVRP